uniref:Uncharacterized protein n=1 Tax=Acrobeloides nanus TaxID=290746 RepID=A0A914DCW0_9BILA
MFLWDQTRAVAPKGHPPNQYGTRKNTNWPSIIVLAFTAFLATLAAGSLIPTIWPYLRLIDPQVTDLYSGYITSLSAVGHVIAAIVAGYLSNKLNNVKCALILGKCLHISAAIMYLTIELFPTNRRYMFLLCDFISGLGIGAFMIARTHIAMACREKHLQRGFAILTIAITLGMSIGTLFNTIFKTFGYPGREFIFGTHLNLYTAPIYFSICMNLIGLMILGLFFHGKLSPNEKKDKEKPKEKRISFDKLAVGLCFMVRIIISFVMIINQTLGTVYSMAVFQWNSSDAVYYHSLVHGIMGVIGLCVYVAYMTFNINKWFPERVAILTAIFCYFAFYSTTYPWPFYDSTIIYQTVTNNTEGNITATAGCNPSYKWCSTTPAVNVWVYHIMLLLFLGLGMPILNVNLDIVFAKILGPIKQGTMHGWFLAVGNSINIFGPLVVSRVYVASGPRYIWLFIICGIFMAFIALVLFYRRLVSYWVKNHDTSPRSMETTLNPSDIKMIMINKDS